MLGVDNWNVDGEGLRIEDREHCWILNRGWDWVHNGDWVDDRSRIDDGVYNWVNYRHRVVRLRVVPIVPTVATVVAISIVTSLAISTILSVFTIGMLVSSAFAVTLVPATSEFAHHFESLSCRFFLFALGERGIDWCSKVVLGNKLVIFTIAAVATVAITSLFLGLPLVGKTLKFLDVHLSLLISLQSCEGVSVSLVFDSGVHSFIGILAEVGLIEARELFSPATSVSFAALVLAKVTAPTLATTTSVASSSAPGSDADCENS